VTPVLSVIVPCYNEEGNIPRLRNELFPVLERLQIPFEVVLVDDGSRDGTAGLLEALSKERPETRVLRHGSNRGLGAAIRTGISAARGEWTVTLDADLTFPPDEIGRLIEAQSRSGADCVAGSPFLGRFETVPWRRRLPSLVINGLYRIFFDPHLTAYTPIFRLYRTETVKKLPFQSQGFEISAEILALLALNRKKIDEIPVTLKSRTWGSSKLRPLRELFNHLRLIYRLRWGK
jgi:dolichol-phosphate mannosyltransferase